MEVAAHDAVLDFAWKDLVRVCLQLDPIPQYVVLTNQRDLQLYDLARDREAPRLSIRIDDLPKYSEAFPFFTKEWVPGATPKIVNVEKVSAEVADLVARLYRSVRAAHPARDRDVIRFTLQCITAMFAEDIGMRGTSAADCGVVYGSIVWLLKNTKSASSSLSNRQHVLRASRAAIEGAIQSMPNLDRIICLGSVSYTGLARMHDLPNVWGPDLAGPAHYGIKTDARLVEVYPTSHLGGLGLAQRAPTRTAALDACLDDFKRALA